MDHPGRSGRLLLSSLEESVPAYCALLCAFLGMLEVTTYRSYLRVRLFLCSVVIEFKILRVGREPKNHSFIFRVKETVPERLSNLGKVIQLTDTDTTTLWRLLSRLDT